MKKKNNKIARLKYRILCDGAPHAVDSELFSPHPASAIVILFIVVVLWLVGHAVALLAATFMFPDSTFAGFITLTPVTRRVYAEGF